MLSLPPTFDPIRDALNSHIRLFSKLVGWATIVVAIGVALEGIEIVHDSIAWWKHKRRKKRERGDLEEVALVFPCGEARGETESHSDHPRWVKRCVRVGLIAVVIGVVGEWRFGAKLEEAHNAVHEYDIGKLTEADQKAGEAKQSAEDASKAAFNAKLAADAAAAEVFTVRGEVSARRLSAKQKDSRRVALQKMPTPIAIGSNPLDNEAVDFALDFLAVMKSANWSAQPLNWLPNGKYGLFIGFTDKEGFDTPQFKLLRDALRDTGWPAVPLPLTVGDKSLSWPAEPHVMYLLIGTHPPVNNRTPTQKTKSP